MKLTVEQEQAIQNGRVVDVTVAGASCVPFRKDVYERGDEVDYSFSTTEEMDLLGAETADLVGGDGLNEPEDLLVCRGIQTRGQGSRPRQRLFSLLHAAFFDE